MKKWLTYGALFFVIYLVFLIVNIPAIWVVEQVESPQGVEVKSTQGTLWHARFEVIQLPENVMLHNVEVHLSFFSLLLFNPTMDITFGGDKIPGPQGELSVLNLFSALTLKDVKITIDANDLLSQVDLPIALTAHNKIKVSIPEYEMGDPVCKVSEGQVNWQKAAITAFEESIDLGNLNATISCEKGLLYLTIDPKNNLGLTYEVAVKNKGKASGNGFIKPDENFPEQLKMALPFLGNADSQGRYKLNF